MHDQNQGPDPKPSEDEEMDEVDLDAVSGGIRKSNKTQISVDWVEKNAGAGVSGANTRQAAQDNIHKFLDTMNNANPKL